MHKFYFILFSCIVLFGYGCANKYVFLLSDKEIEAHYANQPLKPKYFDIKTKHGNVNYATMGDSTKPLLVFIHGAPGHWYSYMHMFNDKDLQSQYFMVSYDRPGFGKSSAFTSLTSIAAQTDVLTDIIKATNFTQQKVTILGSSYGSPIAAKYAMAHNNIEKLLLLAPCLDPAKEKYFWYSYAAKLGFINAFLPRELNNTADEKFQHKRELKLMQHDWHKITAPTWIVQGRNDDIADTANSYFGYEKITNADVTMMLIDSVTHTVARQRRSVIKSILLK